jgi:cytochrome oxidase Cu insertion factor (SCO1/SenC/PrrC family)
MLLTLSLSLMLADLTMAQPQNPARNREGADSPRQDLNRNFGARGPAVGETVPDLSFFDADGKKLSLHSLKGKYTVLVFGCLT